MKIKRTINLEAIISDELFWYLLNAGLQYSDQSRYGNYWIDEFSTENKVQRDIYNSIYHHCGDDFDLDEWWELVSECTTVNEMDLFDVKIFPTTQHNWNQLYNTYERFLEMNAPYTSTKEFDDDAY
jgi:hypothetical protein